MKNNISVVICTYNRVKFIEDCLQHLYNQTLDKKHYELIVVNNNCSDGTETVVNKFISTYSDLNIRQVVETNQGLSYARNRGVDESKYDIICFIDDDGMASEDFLEKIIEHFTIFPETAGIGGKVIPIYESEEPKWYNPFLRMMVTKIDFGDKIFKCYGKKYPAGCCMIYKKEWLIEAGGFNVALKWRADDKYIFKQIRKLNSEIYFVPTISVGHHIDDIRVSDENFNKLSRLLGSEERIRILGAGRIYYLPKLLEFLFKYFATFLIAFYYTITGQYIKGKYVIRFRWLALKGFINF